MATRRRSTRTDRNALRRCLDSQARPARGQCSAAEARTARTPSAAGPAGLALPITAAHAERIACDHVHIGDLDTNALTKPQSAIPAAIRRKVWVRDKGQCVVPGCGSCRYLEAHHLRPRALGGPSTVENLALLCDAHHTQLHEGLMAITGLAPDLTFEFETSLSPTWD